jgi:DNA-directed RNA polymerase beta subunit
MVEDINNKLVEMGHESFSIEEFEDPRTKTTYKMAIGVVHARILKHTAYDKIKAVGHDHSIDKATKQPTGKNASKPMRISYMSVDVYSSFGAVSTTYSLTSRQSDMISVPLCANCGMICDRYNDDPNVATDVCATKHCTRCGEKGTIKKTLMNNAAVKAQRMLLQANLTIDYFPVKE